MVKNKLFKPSNSYDNTKSIRTDFDNNTSSICVGNCRNISVFPTKAKTNYSKPSNSNGASFNSNNKPKSLSPTSYRRNSKLENIYKQLWIFFQVSCGLQSYL